MSTIKRSRAVREHLTIDETCRPPVAHTGPRFAPDKWFEVVEDNLYAYLDLCTSHITEWAAQWLGEQAEMRPPELVVYQYEEGFFIPVPEEVAPDVPASVLRIIQQAVKQEARLIRLDRDGEVHAELEVHDW